MFTVQKNLNGISINIDEDFKAIMSYTDTDAINILKKDYPTGTTLSVKKCAEVDVKKIINAVGLHSEINLNVVVPSEEKTAQDFINGLMLVSDKYMKNKRDKASLKRIISKIQINA